MGNFFSYDYQGAPFAFLGTAHILALCMLVLLNVFLLRDRKKEEKARAKTRWILAIILVADESAWHIWNIVNGTWNVQEHLPLHACSILIWLAAYMLIKKDQRIYEFAYFMGINGALQALFTPDIGIYGFPHFRFFQTFISHGLLVTSAVYLTTVEGFRPTWRSMLRVILIANVFMVLVFGVNSLIGSNYLYVNHKPVGPSLLDVLPDWPVYLLYMELIGFFMFSLLYLPFIIRDWQDKKHQKATTNLKLTG
jgi:hypothetical integral membrane protein (TIGR02206 family)